MSQLVQSILAAAKALPEGGLLSPKEFLHLASRAAVDQALTRLTREEKLLRIGRGVYALPVHGRFGARPPSTQTVVEAIEAASGELVVPSGAAEANALGLTTQVPVREVYLTSGPSRKLRLGSLLNSKTPFSRRWGRSSMRRRGRPRPRSPCWGFASTMIGPRKRRWRIFVASSRMSANGSRWASGGRRVRCR